jgi:tricarballylate dehydrogenase
MAVDVGAAMAGQFDGAHLEPVDPRSSNREGIVGSWLYGIAVNSNGERFMDEAERPFDLQFDVVANRLFREQNGIGYAIIDARIRELAPAIAYMNDAENAPVRADTIEELAERLGLPPDTLSRTVREYNEACEVGGFDPTTFDGKRAKGLSPPKSNWAEPLSTPPYEGVPMTANICFTYGGLHTDGSSRVLDTDGRPIPRLYAAGEIVGVFYEVYPSGTSVLRSLTFGRIAGLTAAAETRLTKPGH